MSDLAVQIDRFLGELRRRDASEHTLIAYRKDFAQLQDYLATLTPAPQTPAELTYPMLCGWSDQLTGQFSPVTVRRKLAALSALYQFWGGEGLVKANLGRLVKRPKAGLKLPDLLVDADQVCAVLEAMGSGSIGPVLLSKGGHSHLPRDLAMLELLYGCGLRVMELAALNLEDLSEGWVLVKGKGCKERELPIPGKAAAALQEWLKIRPAIGNAVFLGGRGRKYEGRITTRGVHVVVRQAGLLLMGDASLHPHTFRHAYATHLLVAGADLGEVQQLMGHATPKVTQVYLQLGLADVIAAYQRGHPRA